MNARVIGSCFLSLLAGLPLAAQNPTIEGRGPEGRLVAFEGTVYLPSGAPGVGAVVVTSAGGQAVVDQDGHYLVEARVPLDARSVQVTAVGRGGGSLAATARVSVPGAPGLVPVGSLLLAAASSCVPGWLPTFGGLPGTNGTVLAMAVFDDGSGSALYLTGDLYVAGGVLANRIVRWDGTSFSALGDGIEHTGHALAVYDDGSGPALYAGGDFTAAGGMGASQIARWDGTSWSPLGGGMNGQVSALMTYDDGGGPALIAGGDFTIAGGVAASRIARWDGTSWSPLGSGMNGRVDALATYDDGGGLALFAGGTFSNAGGVQARRIARWDGTSWTPLGSGMNGQVSALTTFDDGSGPALYATGAFYVINVPAFYTARWDGTSWSPVGAGVYGSINGNGYALAEYDDGRGPALYVGGSFGFAAGVPASRVARWDGSSWSSLDRGMNFTVHSMAVYDDGRGPALYVGGDFTGVGGVTAKRIARWDGTSWSPLGAGVGLGGVYALAVYDAGTGPQLYAGGDFTSADGQVANRIARWDGASWSPLGAGMDLTVRALIVYDDGTGPKLIAGGDFTSAGDLWYAAHIASWDGVSWSFIEAMNSSVTSLAVYDDGAGPKLYAAGSFTTAGGTPANGIACWNRPHWSSLGTQAGFSGSTLAVYDDGAGPALYVGGPFTSVGGMAANRVARWNGGSWSPLGSGTDGKVQTLAVHDDGRGPALYAGGNFTTAGGVAASYVARWDGASWSPLGGGMLTNYTLSDVVQAMATYDDGRGPALYAGGDFPFALDSGDAYIARWSCDIWPPRLACPSSIVVLDRFPNGPGEVVDFSVTATDDLDPSPVVACSPPSGSLFPLGTTLVTCTATDAEGNQSACQFPVVVERKAKPR